MKYGQRLGRYSVPEWRSHNILYDDLKHEIKELTASPTSFSQKGYEVLVQSFIGEIENTNLFVRCKTGEIEYRFQQCDVLVRDLAAKPDDENLYWKLNREVQNLNQEIQNLSRFTGAQYTGVRKLLKKYRRHAPAEQLEGKHRDLKPVEDALRARGSFGRLDLTPQFLELSVLYSTLRTRQFGELVSSSKNTSHSRDAHRVDAQTGSVRADRTVAKNGSAAETEAGEGQDERATEPEQLAHFDVEMLTTSARDVYRFWVHPDSLVQLKVVLLQNMDLVAPSGPENEEREQTSVMYLDTDDLQSARELREPAQVRRVQISHSRLASRPILLVPSGGLRHTAAMEPNDEQYEALVQGKPGAPCISSVSPSNSDIKAQLALGWVSSQNAKPVTSLRSHRTRFKSSTDQVWASIDTNATIENCEGEPSFPYSVLEIRTKRDTEWVDALRNSHLVCPVSASFSLYAWALLQIRPQQVLARPSWLDWLDSGKDIKREPSESGLDRSSMKHSKSVASFQIFGRPTSSPESDNEDMIGSNGSSLGHANGHEPQLTRYWNEFDDGDEFADGDDQFFDEIDEELRRARMAAKLARPVYRLGESMRKQFYTWFDPSKKFTFSASDTDNTDSQSVASVDSNTTEESQLIRHQNSGRFSPRIGSRRTTPYGSVGEGRSNNADHESLENASVRMRHDQGLMLITFLCFCLSLGIVALVFTILLTEDIFLLPSGLRIALFLFLLIALALVLLGYVAYNFRSTQGWSSQVVVHMFLLTVVCFGVGGIANIAVPQL